MTFSKEMVKAKDELEKLGHTVSLPCDVDLHVEDPNAIDDFKANYDHCIANNIIKKCFNKVEASEAILVLNFPKNGIDGYVGTSSLMEMGLAHHFNKKIFLLHEPPTEAEHRWAHEVRIMLPIVLNGDLSKIK